MLKCCPMLPIWSANTSHIFTQKTPQLASVSAPSPRVGFGLHNLAAATYHFHTFTWNLHRHNRHLSPEQVVQGNSSIHSDIYSEILWNWTYKTQKCIHHHSSNLWISWNVHPYQTIPLNTIENRYSTIQYHSITSIATGPAAAASLASRSAKSSCTSLAKVHRETVFGTTITIITNIVIHWWAFMSFPDFET